MPKITTESFHDLYIPVPESGCWLWIGTYGKPHHPILGSYGNYKSDRAHRYSYRLHKGDIPEGMHVCHTCDVRECVNPDHLFLASPYDNFQDMIKKGRHFPTIPKRFPTYEEVIKTHGYSPMSHCEALPLDQQPLWYKLTVQAREERHYKQWRKDNWGQLKGLTYTPLCATMPRNKKVK